MPPIDFLNKWLATHGCGKDVADKTVRLDLGGELGRSQEAALCYRVLVSRFAESPHVTMARRRLAALSPTGTATSPTRASPPTARWTEAPSTFSAAARDQMYDGILDGINDYEKHRTDH